MVKENVESAEGMSEAGLEAKLKLEDPKPKGADPPGKKAEEVDVVPVDGTEKVKPDDDTGAAGIMLNGAAEEEARGAAVEAAAEERPRFGKDVGPDGMEAAVLVGLVTQDPG